MRKKDPVEDRADLRDDEPETTDDLDEARAKSGSVDERIPERDLTKGATLEAPAPASHVPQAGIGVPKPVSEPGPGERVLEKERKGRTVKKQPG